MGIDSSNIRDLAADFSTVPERSQRAAARVVHDIADRGHDLSKARAKVSAGKHGKHYSRAWSLERLDQLGLSWVYGPDASKPQGNMSFEGGSRNQKPHEDLAISADLIRPELGRVVDAMMREVHGR